MKNLTITLSLVTCAGLGFVILDTNKKITTNLTTKKNEIDSLKTELDFRDEMIQTFIKNSETDPIGFRVEAQNK